MRASSYPSVSSPAAPPPMAPQTAQPLFYPFTRQAFSLAGRRHVPVFLVIGGLDGAFFDPSVCAQLSERTVPVLLRPGERPDAEMLCRRAAALSSGEGALPLCALLLPDGRPFLAAPLPPAGGEIDPSRLYIWLAHADRRYQQNPAALARQAAQVLRAFCPPPLTKPYPPQDAAHDLLRAVLAVQDTVNGGFGAEKSPLPVLLGFLAHQAAGSRQAHAALTHALHAMACGALLDPVDGLYFSATLTHDWRVFIPEKPLAVNAMIAHTLLASGERTGAVRILDALTDRFMQPGGALVPALRAPVSRYSYTPEQVCALLGSEDGLRACRLLGLLHHKRGADPVVQPSRFSPQSAPARPAGDERTPLCPILTSRPVPQDEAFLRRILPVLARGRAARAQETPSGPPLTMDCALTAAILAACGKRLGESRYTQAARKAVSFLLSITPDAEKPGALPPTLAAPGSPPTCGAASALSLALLTLAGEDPSCAHALTGLRFLSSALHAFTRESGMVVHTPPAEGELFPRVPAVHDSELPSPAALLLRALRISARLRPDSHYQDAAAALYAAAAPMLRAEPLACAAFIDAADA